MAELKNSWGGVKVYSTPSKAMSGGHAVGLQAVERDEGLGRGQAVEISNEVNFVGDLQPQEMPSKLSDISTYALLVIDNSCTEDDDDCNCGEKTHTKCHIFDTGGERKNCYFLFHTFRSKSGWLSHPICPTLFSLETRTCRTL